MSEDLERLLETHAQVIRDQEQLIQNQRLTNEVLNKEVLDLHAVIQRLNAARRRVPADVSGGVLDKPNSGVAVSVGEPEVLGWCRKLGSRYSSFQSWPLTHEEAQTTSSIGVEIIQLIDRAQIAPLLTEIHRLNNWRASEGYLLKACRTEIARKRRDCAELLERLTELMEYSGALVGSAVYKRCREAIDKAAT